MIRRLLVSAVCAALVWVSPGLEAYAAEGRLIQINLIDPVNTGKVQTGGPVQLKLNGLDIPKGIDTKTGVNTLGVEAGIEAAGNQAQGLAPAATQLQLPFKEIQPAAQTTPSGAMAIIPAGAAVQLDHGANSGVQLEEGWHSDLRLDDSIGRVANIHRLGHELHAVRDFFKGKSAANVGDAVQTSAAAASGETQEKTPEAKLGASSSQAPPAGAQTKAVPAAAPTESGPAATPAKPSDDGGKSKKSSPWRNAYVFIAGLIVAQVGVEAWSAAWAKWVQTSFNTPGHDMYTTVTMVAMGTSLVAGFIGGWITDKLGLKKTFIGTTIGVAAAAAATLALFHFHILTAATPALLIGLVVARAFFNSANGTAQQTVPIAIFKDDKAAFQKYNSSSQFILEIAGIVVPYAIGALLGVFGFVGTLWIMPVALAASAVLLAMMLKIADVAKAKKQTADKPTDSGLLKIAMAGYPALVILNYLLYAVIAIGYGNFLHPGSTPIEQAAASGVAGKIVSLYSMGGLIAAAILSGVPQMALKWLRKKWPWLDQKLSKAADAVAKKMKTEVVKEDDPHADAKAAAKWLIFSAVGIAGFIPLLFTSPMLAALAMIPFGITNVMSTLQLISIAQTNTPPSKKGKIMGTIRTISTALATAGIFGFSKLFAHFPGSRMPFTVFLGLGAVLAAYYVFTSLRLRRHIKSHEAATQPVT